MEEKSMVDKCRLCGSAKLKLYYTEGNSDQFKYYRCEDCLLVNYDLAGGFDQEKHEEAFTDPRESNKTNKIIGHSWAYIKRRLPETGKKRLLDIGSNNGRLLMLASADGWQVQGIELLESLAERCRAALNLPVSVFDFLTYEPAPEETYDLVVLRHVLEHLPDPVLALNKIHALLAPGGYVHLEFPNTASADMRLKWWLRRTGLKRRRFSKKYVPHHCNEFRREPMELLCKMTGFELVHWTTYSSNNNLSPFYEFFRFGCKARTLIRKIQK